MSEDYWWADKKSASVWRPLVLQEKNNYIYKITLFISSTTSVPCHIVVLVTENVTAIDINKLTHQSK